jgi:hypothetical protein
MEPQGSIWYCLHEPVIGPYPEPINSVHTVQSIYWRPISILSSYPLPSITTHLFYSGFPAKTLYCIIYINIANKQESGKDNPEQAVDCMISVTHLSHKQQNSDRWHSINAHNFGFSFSSLITVLNIQVPTRQTFQPAVGGSSCYQISNKQPMGLQHDSVTGSSVRQWVCA